MLIGHFGGSPEHTEDSYVTTPSFSEIGFKCAYSFSFSSKIGLELFSGIKNLTNAYQSDFDSGKNRDSNYIYGPAAPRTYFLGLKLKSI